MKLLWDTHTFLWFVSGNEKLPEAARFHLSNSSNSHFISIASLWEISIKTAIGKLEIHGEYASVIMDVTSNGIGVLPIQFSHTLQQHKLPFHHRDPFDRIIVAQAIVEEMVLVSKDAIFDEYLTPIGANRLWDMPQ